jgi:hypothetical protein
VEKVHLVEASTAADPDRGTAPFAAIDARKRAELHFKQRQPKKHSQENVQAPKQELEHSTVSDDILDSLVNTDKYEDDGIKIKWGFKWKWFVVSLVERILNNAFQQAFTADNKPGKRATVFGTILQSYLLQSPLDHCMVNRYNHLELPIQMIAAAEEAPRQETNITAADDAPDDEDYKARVLLGLVSKARVVSKPAKARKSVNVVEVAVAAVVANADLAQRAVKAKEEKASRGKLAMEAMKKRSRRASKDMDFHNLVGERRGSGLVDVLKDKYNHHLAEEGNEFYTPNALLRRESLQFDHEVMKALSSLWKSTDKDGSGAVNEDEYMSMHKAMHCALCKLDHLESGGREHEAQAKREHEGQAKWDLTLARLDWDADREGSGILNFGRFKRCWFQIADRFTDDMEPSTYAAFLNEMIVHMELDGDWAKGEVMDIELQRQKEEEIKHKADEEKAGQEGGATTGKSTTELIQVY